MPKETSIASISAAVRPRQVTGGARIGRPDHRDSCPGWTGRCKWAWKSPSAGEQELVASGMGSMWGDCGAAVSALPGKRPQILRKH